jgi:hypothetical protein
MIWSFRFLAHCVYSSKGVSFAMLYPNDDGKIDGHENGNINKNEWMETVDWMLLVGAQLVRRSQVRRAD